MFADQEYRKQIVENLKDPVIKAFWHDEFANYTQRLETEALAAIQNKVGQFVSNPLIRNILGQPRSTLNMREIMDSGKIFIVNLSKGKIGEDNSALLGAMIITRMNLAAMSRVDIKNEDDRRDFFAYVDEFQNFATDSFASILSEARKYRLSLVLAHQYIGQLTTGDSTKVRDAIFGNVGTIITFRVGAPDAEFLEKEFMPQFLQADLVNLARANIYVRLMIDGMASQPFSAETLPPTPTPLVSYRDVIVRNSEEHYGLPRAVVEEKIAGGWSTSSKSSADTTISRRGEQGLGQTLRPGAPVQRRAPRMDTPPPLRTPASVSANPSSSQSQSSSANFPPRQPAANISSPASRPAVSAPAPAPISAAAPAPVSVSASAPIKVSDPVTAPSSPSASEHVRPQVTSPTSSSPSAQTKPSISQSNSDTRPNFRADRPEEKNAVSTERDTMIDEFVKSRAEKPQVHKQFVKPTVDINELRKAISKSLGKKPTDTKEVTEEKEAVATTATPGDAPKQ